ncbi:MMPL family transporter [Bacillus velezensis]|uniref:MMPL family transporter n=1 Tax=Bacillus velezensis TaxID=492670 RepID=UPI001D06BD58|nr:MMPL family transporter [Bacillus velezensis]MCB7144272.1 MMPL family transporter [Bacillus velezensis]MCC2532945.1 MMPL family transporter [Bacillus velezensis]MCC2552002.1 MMPL family transporter [Bacillus velezensis]
MSGFLYKLGGWSARNRLKMISAWLVILIASIVIAISLKPAFSEDMSIPDTPSEKAMDIIQKEFSKGPDKGSIRVIFGAEDGKKLTSKPEKQAIEETLKKIKTDHSVASIASPFETGTISKDGSVAYADITYKKAADDITDASVSHIKHSLSAAGDKGLQTELSGDVPGAGVEIGGVSEIVGVVLAFVVLAITFGSLVIAGLPIVTALIGLGVSIALTLIGTQFFTIASVSLSLSGMIGLAVGIDYALFIFTKHRQFLGEGVQKNESIAKAAGTAGSAVVFAGLTVIVALCGLTVVGIPFMSAMGLTAALSVLMAVLASVTLVPAVLSIAGKRMIPKSYKKKEKKSADTNAWGRFVTKKPILLSIFSIILLAVISLPAMHLELGLPDAGMKAKDSPDRRAYDLLSKGFGEGFNGKLTIVADARGVKGNKSEAFQDAVKEMKDLHNVASVTPAMPNEKGDYAIITAVPETGPNDKATKELVQDIRKRSDKNGFRLLVTGSTAVNIDISDRLNDAIPEFAILIVGFAFVLLTVVFRSLLVPLAAVIGFLLTMTATLGLSVFILQDGNFTGLLSIPEKGPILAFLPILAIGILFGLAMDYQVFLVSRMREEYVKTKNPVQAIHAGLKHSGPVVTAAGLIMIFVFAGFIFAGEATIKSMGLAMTFGVLFDAFIVRMTIIPSVMKLMGHTAWYLPKWLDKIIPNVDIEGHKLTQGKTPEKPEE